MNQSVSKIVMRMKKMVKGVVRELEMEYENQVLLK
jgi:hypothetical protein